MAAGVITNSVAGALNILSGLLNTIANATAQANTVSAMIVKAQAEGRNTFNADEWASIDAANKSSRDALVAAIQAALNSGA